MTATPITFDHWSLPPISGASAYREMHRNALRRFRAKNRALGLCSWCWRRPAGSDGGTGAFCGPCRRARKAKRKVKQVSCGVQSRGLESGKQIALSGSDAHSVGPSAEDCITQSARTVNGSSNGGYPIPPAGKKPPRAENLAFKSKPAMHEGAARIERMCELSARIEKLKRNMA